MHDKSLRAKLIDRVERRQITVLAHTMTVPPSSPSVVEDDALPANRRGARSMQKTHSSRVVR